MAQGLVITRDEHTAAELRRASSRSRDSSAARRMLALALIKEGRSRTEAAQSCGMDRQTLRDWVHRYNDAGLAGLSDKVGRRFRRWSELGVWQRVFDALHPDGDGAVVSVDATICKAHRAACGARGGSDEALGVSRGRAHDQDPRGGGRGRADPPPRAHGRERG